MTDSSDAAGAGWAGGVAAGPRAHLASIGAPGAGWLLVLPLALLSLFLIGPLVMVAVTSGGQSGIRTALSDPLVGDALRRTLAVAATVTAITVVLGTVYALAITATRGVLHAVLVGALLTGFWVSILVRTLGWVLLYEPEGPLDRALHALRLLPANQPIDLLQTTRGMYPAMVHVMLPYMVLPIWAALRAQDPEQVRAARSLGAGPLMVLRRVVLPQARTGILAGSVLVFTLSLGFYITPRILGGPSDLTVGTLVGTQFESSLSGDFSEPAAVGLILVVAILVLYTVTDRLARMTERVRP